MKEATFEAFSWNVCGLFLTTAATAARAAIGRFICLDLRSKTKSDALGIAILIACRLR
jgi:hypothetical protein